MLIDTEIELLDREIEIMKKLLKGNEPVFRKLEAERNKLIQTKEKLMAAIDSIEDPEIHDIIVCRYIKRRSWPDTFTQALPGIMSEDPASYCRCKVRRYLAKHPDLKELLENIR